MEFQGSFETPASANAVRALVLNPESIKGCLPGVTRFERVEGGFKTSFKLDVRDAGVPQMDTISIMLDLHYEESTNEIGIHGKGRAAGSGVSFNLIVIIKEHEGGSSVAWRADVQFGWIIRLFGEKTVSEITRKNVDSIIECIKRELELGTVS
ncbi:MAG: SRPBCC domain-containing protein [Thermoprotei archaeon]|nr:SRPBCC domain-containing protein [TACK group archaeon]